jgi:hypothetical protein
MVLMFQVKVTMSRHNACGSNRALAAAMSPAASRRSKSSGQWRILPAGV